MTNSALHHPTLAQEARNVGLALRELAVATARLSAALWAALVERQQPCPAKTARQEADRLRAYADEVSRSDPRYAQDLYAAACRHERAATSR